MADPKYDIYFRGEILAGADDERVKAAIAKVFKADAAKLARAAAAAATGILGLRAGISGG